MNSLVSSKFYKISYYCYYYFFYYFFVLFSTMFMSAFLNYSYGQICGIQFQNVNMFMYSLLISNSTTCKTIHKASYFFSNSVDNLLLGLF